MSAEKIFRVSVRMLLDYLKVLTDKQDDFEIGCRCKDEETAVGLKSLLEGTLRGLPANVVIKEDTTTVVILAEKKTESTVDVTE